MHLTIAISGWLSQNDNPQKSWRKLIDFFHQGETFNLKWEASSVAKSITESVIPIGLFIGKLAAYPLYMKSCETVSFAKDNPFYLRIGKAKTTGKMLADIITTNKFLKSIPITLVSFSMGTRVVYECLKKLTIQGHCVHDVILLGGATPNKTEGWRKCRAAVTGRLINCFSREDSVLSIWFLAATMKKAIGTCPIEVEGIENFDVTDIIKGHNQYRSELDKILKRIHYNSK